MKSNDRPRSMLILHHIRSAENVGSLFRTADAAGVDRIYLSAITAAPVDRFGRPNAKVAKTALGAENAVAWEQYADISALIGLLKGQGVTCVAVEQSALSVDYKTVAIGGAVAFILGNEVDGLPQPVLDQADIIAEIPMAGGKESLNVAVAAGVALFRILDR